MKAIAKTLSTLTALFFLITGCSEEPIQDNLINGGGRTLSITASMPADGQQVSKTTRIALDQKENRDISLSWEAGDIIHLVLVQGGNKITQDITVKAEDISSNGKSVDFDIILPQEIDNNSFDLYGVYGGGGLSPDDPTIAVLPSNPGKAESLASLQERKDVMLTF